MARGRASDGHSGGFTIIETMLVMAVAGFIIIIVLMAIPALQRSSRNNQRKQDVQSILGAISSYKLNNSGSMPVSASNFLKYAKLSSYPKTTNYISGGIGTPNTNGVNIYTESPSVAPKTESNSSLDTVDVYNYRKCATNPEGSATNSGAGFGDVVALYAVETGHGVGSQCQQL